MALTQVSTSGIKDGSVSTADLADDCVTADKLNNTGVTAGSYTLSSVTVDAQGRVTAASSGTPVDADKIIEGNTEVEAVDTGSDGHIKATTEGSERLRVGPAGQVGIGGANYGTSGQVLMSGGASAAPTWGDVSSSPTFEATASGTIADGKALVVNSDGTVSTISGSGTAAAQGTDSAFGSHHAQHPSVAYDTTRDKVITVYQNSTSSNQIFSNIGTVNSSNRTVSFQDSKAASSDSSMETPALVYDPNANRVFYLARDGSNGSLKYNIGSLNSNGDTITWSGNQNFRGTSTEIPQTIYDPDTNNVICAYKSAGESDVGKLIPVTLPSSGNNITFGTEITFNNSVTRSIALAYDTYNDKTVVFYSAGSSYAGKAKVVSLSGSGNRTPSLGSEATFDTDAVRAMSATFCSNTNKVVVFYENTTDNDHAYAVVGTVSGTSITFGTPIKFNAGATPQLGAGYYATGNRVFCAYRAGGSSFDGLYIAGRVTGTTINFDTAVNFNNQQASYPDVTHDPDTDNMIVAIRADESFFNEGQLWVIKPDSRITNLTTDNYVGISSGSYTNGQTVTVQAVGSVDDAQSGLTPGTGYYLNKNTGALQTTADTISVKAGVALSATKLLIK